MNKLLFKKEFLSLDKDLNFYRKYLSMRLYYTIIKGVVAIILVLIGINLLNNCLNMLHLKESFRSDQVIFFIFMSMLIGIVFASSIFLGLSIIFSPRRDGTLAFLLSFYDKRVESKSSNHENV